MNITIEISWWIIPAVATVTAFAWAWFEWNKQEPAGTMDIVGPVIFLLYFGLATIVSLIAWLVWALLS